MKSKEVSKLPLASFRWYNYILEKTTKLRANFGLFSNFLPLFLKVWKTWESTQESYNSFHKGSQWSTIVWFRCCFPGHSHDRSEIREVTGQLTRSEVISEGASSGLLTLLKTDENGWFHYAKWFQHENFSRILLMIESLFIPKKLLLIVLVLLSCSFDLWIFFED